ncbi:MAG: AAA family ATPase [Clostridiales bacterium]|jgi:hypothetical protein|nr:AAA family ATPase [Clostridiales bacterium]
MGGVRLTGGAPAKGRIENGQGRRENRVRITLERLRIRNFKAIGALDLCLGGKNATISGRNASGKTSAYDAFSWLLFGKNSAGKADFDVRPLGAPDRDQPSRDPEVEAALSVDGAPLLLKKRHAAKWVKKRGEPEPAFAGCQTQCWADDVPLRIGEYEKRVGGLCDEDLFRLITSAGHFPEALDWKSRRKMLSDMAGGASDADALAGDPQLRELAPELARRSAEDIRKIAADRARAKRKELDGMRPRVEELASRLPDETDAQRAGRRAAAESGLRELEARRLELDGEAARPAPGQGRTATLRREIAGLESKREERVCALSAKAREAHFERQSARIGAEGAARVAESRLRNAENRAAGLERDAAAASATRDALRGAWDAESRAKFAEPQEGAGACPTCGQPMPEAASAGALARRRNSFAEAKKRRLAEISAEGKAVAARLAALEEELSEARRALEEARAAERGVKKRLSALPPLEEYAAPKFDGDSDAQLKLFDVSLELARKKLGEASAESGEDARLGRIAASRRELEEESARLQGELASIARDEADAARLAELEAEARRVSAELMAAEKTLALAGRLAAAKAAALGGKINAMFSRVSFALCREQENGELAECCEACVGNTPYASLSASEKVNAGLDIINAVSARRGVWAPIFIDNAEGVNRLEATGAQLIRLAVSEGPLEVSVDGEPAAGAAPWNGESGESGESSEYIEYIGRGGRGAEKEAS